jgi:hypothetical protein
LQVSFFQNKKGTRRRTREQKNGTLFTEAHAHAACSMQHASYTMHHAQKRQLQFHFQQRTRHVLCRRSLKVYGYFYFTTTRAWAWRGSPSESKTPPQLCFPLT